MMNTKRIKLSVFRWEEPVRIFVLLLLLWTFGPIAIRWMDDTAGSVDQSIWLLILLSLIGFLLVTALSWWILKIFWLNMGLPPIFIMVSRFNNLEIWHQVLFFQLSFGLLLLAATGCMIALC